MLFSACLRLESDNVFAAYRSNTLSHKGNILEETQTFSLSLSHLVSLPLPSASIGRLYVYNPYTCYTDRRRLREGKGRFQRRGVDPMKQQHKKVCASFNIIPSVLPRGEEREGIWNIQYNTYCTLYSKHIEFPTLFKYFWGQVNKKFGS